MTELRRGSLFLRGLLIIAFCAANLVAFSTSSAAVGTTHYVSTTVVAVLGLDTSCSEPGYNSIQAAVTDSAPGDTIVVCDGVYQEQVTITQDLTLIGSGNAVIKAPASLAAPGDLVMIRRASVVMSGFIVSGPGSGNCESIQAGIRVFDGARLDLSSTTVRDIHDQPLGGCQSGEAIRIGARGGVGAPGHATLDNVVAVGYQKNGITVDGTGSTANIMNVTVRGAGPVALGFAAQNGIQVSRGASATISTSTIRDHDYVPNTFFACGLLIFQANGVNDDTNIFLNNEKDKCTFGGRGGTYEGMP